MDNDRNLKEAIRSSLFDEPVDLYHYNQIQATQSPSLSFTRMAQASRSVPGSRRNSNDDHSLDLLLGKKLSLNDKESSFSSRKLPFAMTPIEPMSNKRQSQLLDNYDPIGTPKRQSLVLDNYAIEPIGTPKRQSLVLDNFSLDDGVSKRQSQILDGFSADNDVPLFNPLITSKKDSPIHSDDYAEMFTMNQVDHNTQPMNRTAEPLMSQVMEPEPEPRRYSFGWHSDNNRSRSNSNRLTSSQSFTDLASLNFNQKEILCPNFQEFGYCSRQNVCPFVHPTTPQPTFASTKYQQYTIPKSMNTNNNYYYNQVPPMTSNTPSPQVSLNNNKVKKFDLSTSNQRQQQQQQQPVSQQQQQQQQDRFTDAKIEDYFGKLYELCKDQNGCRFLQRKIEGTEEGKRNLEHIFNEILEHFVELMTDPFGNYLCQKMLEKCNNEQRTAIIKIVAPELVHIALNMHGTRAVQRLIEYLSTPEQIKIVTNALNPNVVTLIKDLNGNHVIQKCLHRLSPENNQFIYDAVCENCIEVASHKHGCCVLQRCFDHATSSQKDQLVAEISKHALPLVQNPFGNYVVQYVLELGVVKYSESVIARFVNHVYILSVQKFSSNVIENCIRTAQPQTRRLLIAELINPTIMEKLLHDSFANYVVQTSLDFADEDQRIQLVECIKPLLPSIRTTPYGKRIHSKIFRENKLTGRPAMISPQQRSRPSSMIFNQ